MSAWALRYSRRDPSFITQPMMRTVHLRQCVSGPLNFKSPADNPSLLGQRQEIHLLPTTGTLLRSPHNRNQSDNRSMDANYKLAPILTLALPILRSASRKDTQLSRPLQHNHLLPTSIINNLPTNHTLPSRPNPPHNLPIPITIPNHHDHPNHAPQTSLPNRQNQMGLHPLRSPFRHLRLCLFTVWYILSALAQTTHRLHWMSILVSFFRSGAPYGYLLPSKNSFLR